MMSQMIIRIDESLKNNVRMLAKSDGKTTSEIVRNLLSSFVSERDFTSYIENLWNRVGDSFKSQGYTSKDVSSIIKEVRMTKSKK